MPLIMVVNLLWYELIGLSALKLAYIFDIFSKKEKKIAYIF
jgi:hypothetical protein